MKVGIRNLGILRQAEFSLGELTIICGENNTGKTYATYALYGFLKVWREHMASAEITRIADRKIEELMGSGATRIDPEAGRKTPHQAFLQGQSGRCGRRTQAGSPASAGAGSGPRGRAGKTSA